VTDVAPPSTAAPASATEAARLLLAVRRGAPRLAGLPATLAPQTLAEAYAVQHALLGELDTDIAGWKASLSSADEGICAPLPACAVLDAPAYPAALRPPLPGSGPWGIEAEVAFRLGHDLPPLPGGAQYDRETVRAAVVSAHAVIEVIESRYADDGAVPHFARVADSYMNLLLVVGPSCPAWRELSIEELPLELRIDGLPVHQGRGGHPLGDPLLALIWIANHLGQFGRGLRGGELVTTGSCSGVRHLRPGQVASAWFDGLGTAVVNF
jgi:2-keto-4-pentenoate hydratase